MSGDEDDGNPLAITRWYRAPEVLAEGEYGPGVDIWALGCILAEVRAARCAPQGCAAPHACGGDAAVGMQFCMGSAGTAPLHARSTW